MFSIVVSADNTVKALALPLAEHERPVALDTFNSAYFVDWTPVPICGPIARQGRYQDRCA